MKSTEKLNELIKKADSQSAILAAIGHVVVESLDKINTRLFILEQSLCPNIGSVDVVGHSGVSPQVSTASTIKADKVKSRSKKIQS